MTAVIKEQTQPDQKQDVTGILQRSLMFSDMGADILQPLVEAATLQIVPKGKILFVHEEKAEFFYVIVSGWVKLFRETLNGEEAVIDVRNSGHVFGEMAIFGHDFYDYGAEVVEPAVLVTIPLAILRRLVEANTQISMQIFRLMSQAHRLQIGELEHRSVQNAPQRIGCFLLRLCKPGDEGPITLHLPYDKTLIASRLGMKAETFSRALARLRRETGIRTNGGSVEIDAVSQLSQYSCAACSSSYPCQDLPR
ncbi:MAG: Crp/Fnr family transcriptional regulator [Pseudomonadota bacterium]